MYIRHFWYEVQFLVVPSRIQANHQAYLCHVFQNFRMILPIFECALLVCHVFQTISKHPANVSAAYAIGNIFERPTIISNKK